MSPGEQIDRRPAGGAGRDPAPRPSAFRWSGGRLLLLVAFWSLFGAFTAWDWLWSPMATQCPYPERLAASALFNAYLWALLTPAVFRLATRLNPDRGARLPRALLLLVLALAVSLPVTLVEASVHLQLHPFMMGSRTTAEWDRFWTLTTRWYSREVMTFVGVLVAGIAMDNAWRHRARRREALELQAQAGKLQAERAELQAQSAELSAQLAEARLAMLRTQLNPHFLFNTLNAVSALVVKDPRRVQDMIALLGELLRHALKDVGEQEIPLHEELDLLRIYLEILEIRYQGQLKAVVDVDPGVHEALVPNLILQPLVENAIKHGIDRAEGSGTVEVRARRAGDDLVLAVRDTGPGSEIATPTGEGGVGLRLTRERLSGLYGGEARLELRPAPGGGTIAEIVLPYHAREDVRVAEAYAHS
jgi:signal transduction histidine kinase